MDIQRADLLKLAKAHGRVSLGDDYVLAKIGLADPDDPDDDSIRYYSPEKLTVKGVKAGTTLHLVFHSEEDEDEPEELEVVVTKPKPACRAPNQQTVGSPGPRPAGPAPRSEEVLAYLNSLIPPAESAMRAAGIAFGHTWLVRIEKQRANAQRNRGGWNPRAGTAVIRIGVERGLALCAKQLSTDGYITRNEYAHIARSPTIGTWVCTDWRVYFTLAFLHEFAHCLQLAPAHAVRRPAQYDYAKAHGEGWQYLYGELRERFGLTARGGDRRESLVADTPSSPSMTCKTFNGWLEKAGLPHLTEDQYVQACRIQPPGKIADAARKCVSVPNARIYLVRLLKSVGIVVNDDFPRRLLKFKKPSKGSGSIGYGTVLGINERGEIQDVVSLGEFLGRRQDLLPEEFSMPDPKSGDGPPGGAGPTSSW